MQLARLISLGPPIQAGTSNQTWVAMVATASGQLEVVLKALTVREFFNELLAWGVGSALQLPIPAVFLVAAEDKPDLSNALSLPSGERLCFGSARAPYPSFNKHMGITDPIPPLVEEMLRQALTSWPGCGEAVAFDTWVANVDRNAGNLLYGQNGMHILIDHGRCLTGPKWVVSDLAPASAYENRLAGAVARFVIGAQDRQMVANGIIDFGVRAATVQLGPVVDTLRKQGWISDTEAQAVASFLMQRISSIVSLARLQAGV